MLVGLGLMWFFLFILLLKPVFRIPCLYYWEDYEEGIHAKNISSLGTCNYSSGQLRKTGFALMTF